MTAIYVSGFDYGTSEDILESHFSTVGQIEDLRMQGSGGAVINYKDAAAADKAVEELNGTTMEGQRRYVSVKLDGDKGERKGGKGDRDGKGKGKGKSRGGGGYGDHHGEAVFANGYDYETTERDLERHFGKVGKVRDLQIISSGSAVIVYESEAVASRAVEELDGSTMDGQRRYVSVKIDDPDRRKGGGKGGGKDGKSKSKGTRTSSGDAVFASGFDDGTDENILREHFGDIGEIMDLYFQSRSAAVITYRNGDVASRAVAELDGSTMRGQRRYVSVRIDGERGGKGKGKFR